MQLEPGLELLHYRLIDKIGEGGMGVVWRALDTTLGREVAIKVLPNLFGDQPERLARFQREAKVLASLTHPNIATVHGLHEAGGVRFLAMELVTGEDLSKRIARGALPVDDALRIANAMAQALEAAHDQGIVHRDLKPANVVLTADDQVKVLDFGLAKALDPTAESQSAATPTMSPTLTSAGTVAGMILGTAAYMSPEQAKGKVVDRRADIWAFGVTLHEMLTGKQVYEGETVSETLAAVMMTDPSMEALPESTPPRVLRLLERCLTKDPKARLRDIGEARITLERAIAGEPERADAVGESTTPAWSARGWTLVAVALIAAVAGYFLGKAKAPDTPEPRVRKFEIAVPATMRRNQIALSRDGRRLAYTNDEKLWVRSLDRLEPRALEGAEGGHYPFWSPDGEWLGYASGLKLWKVRVDGGSPTVIAEVPDSFDWAAGAVWLPGDRIVFSTGDTGLMEVSALGGDPTVLLDFEQDVESDLHHPGPLPDGRGFLFVPHDLESGLDTIVVYSGGERKPILKLEGQTLLYPQYVPSGHLIYQRRPDNPGIWAVPFSLSRLELTGDPFLVAPGGRFPRVSADGTLAYKAGSDSTPVTQLVWMDRGGRVVGQVGEAEVQSAFPAISPDGNTIATCIGEDESAELWLHDVTRGTKTRLTFEEGTEDFPFWGPEGTRVYYHVGTTASSFKLFARDKDGTGTAEEILEGGFASISTDGRYVLTSRSVDGEWGVWYRDLEGDSESVPLVTTESPEYMPRISPDGRYFAYTSVESDRSEIYVKKFPSGEGKWQVSVDGGHWPRWSPDGNELYYVRGNDLMTVDVDTGENLVLGAPRQLFSRADSGLTLPFDWPDGFDVSPDGRRFLMVHPVDTETTPARAPGITIVENWLAEFE